MTSTVDSLTMEKAVEFRYAAIRRGKRLIVDMVLPWKGWVCRHILRMDVERIRTC